MNSMDMKPPVLSGLLYKSVSLRLHYLLAETLLKLNEITEGKLTY